MKMGIRVVGLLVVVIVGCNGIYAMQVQKEGVDESKKVAVAAPTNDAITVCHDPIEVKKEVRTLGCDTMHQGVTIELGMHVSAITTGATDFAGTALDKAYTDCLSEFLQQYNKAFEECAKRSAWTLCDVKKDDKGNATDAIFTQEAFKPEELRAMLIKKLAEQLDESKEPEFSDEEAGQAVAVAKSSSLSILTKLSWIPLWLFRKSLMSLLTSGSFASAGFLSLVLLACPAWIGSILGQDILPFVAKKLAPTAAQAALKAMGYTDDQIAWLLKQLKSALGV